MSRPHGRARYIWGPGPGQDRSKACRCDVCCEANRAYSRMQRKRKAVEGVGLTSGPFAAPFVDAGAARLRLLILGDHGLGYERVAELAGVGHTCAFDIRSGAKRRIRRETAEAILRVTLDLATPAGGQRVDARATWVIVNRILRRKGWTKARLGAAIGQGGLSLQLGRRTITYRNAQAIAAVADELGVVHAPELERRFPVEPLFQGRSIAGLARTIGIDNAQLHRWKRSGIPADRADHIAVALGRLPFEIWPDWYAGLDEVAA